jgi:CHAD domain-containing protein
LDVPVASSAVLRSALTEERRSASRELAETMNSERYMRLVGRLHAAAHAAPFSEADRSSSDTSRCLQSEGATNDLLSELVGRQWKSLRRAVRKAGPHPTDEQLHRIRIRSKQLRYAAEAAVPVAGQEAQRIAAASEKLQVVLGTHHDAVAAEAWLRRVPDHQTAASSYAAGQLSVLQRWRQQKFRKQWKRRWARLKRTKTLRWLS